MKRQPHKPQLTLKAQPIDSDNKPLACLFHAHPCYGDGRCRSIAPPPLDVISPYLPFKVGDICELGRRAREQVACWEHQLAELGSPVKPNFCRLYFLLLLRLNRTRTHWHSIQFKETLLPRKINDSLVSVLIDSCEGFNAKSWIKQVANRAIDEHEAVRLLWDIDDQDLICTFLEDLLEREATSDKYPRSLPSARIELGECHQWIYDHSEKLSLAYEVALIICAATRHNLIDSTRWAPSMEKFAWIVDSKQSGK